jgi:endoglucanase
MDSDAMQIASKIKMGINIGNTLEAIGGETNWGNPAISAAYMKLIKDSGFDAVRLPVAWDQYSNQETAEISADWLNRVKQVVQYAVDNELYVIVNIHWDGGWLDENINADMQAATNAKQKAFWEQIATHLRDFDEHLLFASANEPPIEEGDTEGMAILDSYHQTFVDTVRATGGKNAYRVLVVQGPSTNIETTYDLWEQMPNDSVVGRQMAEIHFYGPFNFGLMEEDADWGLMSYYWGEGFHSTTDTERNATWGEEDWVDQQFDLMKTKFVDQGIPVVMGEYGAILRDNLSGDSLALHRASRAYFHLYVTERANSSGILPFVWEIGYSPFPLFDRATPAVADHQLLDALLMGAGKASSSASSTSSSANSSSSSIETSSASSSSSSSMSNEIVLDTSPGRWRVDDGVVKNESASNIEFTLSSADQAGTYDADTPINMANATFNVVLNFDQEFVDNRSGGMDGILQFFIFSPSWEASEYKCWTGWVSLVAGQDITFSCSDFSIEDAVGMGLQFFATEGTVIIKSATIELAN